MDEVRYQVFVSSTFTDLKEERAKVLQAILELKAFPAGMELFPSADDEQFEFIKREIDSSDYYVLVIAGRYGSVKDGISFTEMEYDYAISKGKPVLSFLHHDLQQLVSSKLESTDEVRAKVNAFREKARKSRLVSYFQNPDDLKAKVLSSLVSQINLKPMRGWVRAGQTPREALESINHLQQRVIDLESENSQLRALQGDSVAQLAKGQEEISWLLDLNGFSFGNKWPTVRELDLTSTWDHLLLTAFPGGRSQVLAVDVRRSIARLILTSIVPIPEDATFREAAASHLKGDQHHFPTLVPVEQILYDMHRQFAGLGLVEESMETVYTPQLYGAAPLPKTMSAWKLTRQGEKHIALIRGHLSDTSST
jgi:nucleoside 2-deoxyribosyltransferase